MKAQDYMNNDDKRAKAIRALQERCELFNLSYEYTDKLFTIHLPKAESELLPSLNPATKTRKTFNTDDWGETGPSETGHILPDELPPNMTPLEEGEPPKGDDEL